MTNIFILPVYNHFNYAMRAAYSIVQHTIPQSWSILVIVDDAKHTNFNTDIYDWPQNCTFTLRTTRKGLTAAWNEGLTAAKNLNAEYAVCANSDILCTEGWFPPLEYALNNGLDLAGPVTNAPGHQPLQSVSRYTKEFELSDDRAVLTRIARSLKDKPPFVLSDYINGFFMIAKTETWWANPFDAEHVFDPSIPLAGNENELQLRWKQANHTIGFVPQSYIFHYKRVSRGTEGRQVIEGLWRYAWNHSEVSEE